MISTSPRRACVYLRVSSETSTVETQKPDVVQLCQARGLNIVMTIEETMSAVKQRPGWDRVMAAAHRGEFDVVVVWALDRLGRSMVGNLQAVLELDRLGVEVVSVRESWLTMSGPVRALLIGVFSWVAEQERARVVERTKAGVARARREGKQIGRPRVVVDLHRALQLRRQGLSIRQVAQKLDVKQSTLHRLLQLHDREVQAVGDANQPLGCGTATSA